MPFNDIQYCLQFNKVVLLQWSSVLEEHILYPPSVDLPVAPIEQILLEQFVSDHKEFVLSGDGCSRAFSDYENRLLQNIKLSFAFGKPVLTQPGSLILVRRITDLNEDFMQLDNDWLIFKPYIQLVVFYHPDRLPSFSIEKLLGAQSKLKFGDSVQGRVVMKPVQTESDDQKVFEIYSETSEGEASTRLGSMVEYCGKDQHVHLKGNKWTYSKFPVFVKRDYGLKLSQEHYCYKECMVFRDDRCEMKFERLISRGDMDKTGEVEPGPATNCILYFASSISHFQLGRVDDPAIPYKSEPLVSELKMWFDLDEDLNGDPSSSSSGNHPKDLDFDYNAPEQNVAQRKGVVEEMWQWTRYDVMEFDQDFPHSAHIGIDAKPETLKLLMEARDYLAQYKENQLHWFTDNVLYSEAMVKDYYTGVCYRFNHPLSVPNLLQRVSLYPLYYHTYNHAGRHFGYGYLMHVVYGGYKYVIQDMYNEDEEFQYSQSCVKIDDSALLFNTSFIYRNEGDIVKSIYRFTEQRLGNNVTIIEKKLWSDGKLFFAGEAILATEKAEGNVLSLEVCGTHSLDAEVLKSVERQVCFDAFYYYIMPYPRLLQEIGVGFTVHNDCLFGKHYLMSLTDTKCHIVQFSRDTCCIMDLCQNFSEQFLPFQIQGEKPKPSRLHKWHVNKSDALTIPFAFQSVLGLFSMNRDNVTLESSGNSSLLMMDFSQSIVKPEMWSYSMEIPKISVANLSLSNPMNQDTRLLSSSTRIQITTTFSRVFETEEPKLISKSIRSADLAKDVYWKVDKQFFNWKSGELWWTSSTQMDLINPRAPATPVSTLLINNNDAGEVDPTASYVKVNTTESCPEAWHSVDWITYLKSSFVTKEECESEYLAYAANDNFLVTMMTKGMMSSFRYSKHTPALKPRFVNEISYTLASAMKEGDGASTQISRVYLTYAKPMRASEKPFEFEDLVNQLKDVKLGAASSSPLKPVSLGNTGSSPIAIDANHRATYHLASGSTHLHSYDASGKVENSLEFDRHNHVKVGIVAEIPRIKRYAYFFKAAVTEHKEPCIIKLKVDVDRHQAITGGAGKKLRLSGAFVEWIRRVVIRETDSVDLGQLVAFAGYTRDYSGHECEICKIGAWANQIMYPCKHKVCKDCITKHLSIKQTCPICRDEFSQTFEIKFTGIKDDNYSLSHAYSFVNPTAPGEDMFRYTFHEEVVISDFNGDRGKACVVNGLHCCLTEADVIPWFQYMDSFIPAELRFVEYESKAADDDYGWSGIDLDHLEMVADDEEEEKIVVAFHPEKGDKQD